MPHRSKGRVNVHAKLAASLATCTVMCQLVREHPHFKVFNSYKPTISSIIPSSTSCKHFRLQPQNFSAPESRIIHVHLSQNSVKIIKRGVVGLGQRGDKHKLNCLYIGHLLTNTAVLHVKSRISFSNIVIKIDKQVNTTKSVLQNSFISQQNLFQKVAF